MSRLNVDQIHTRTGTGSPAIREMPVFLATNSTNQNVTSGVETKVILNVSDFDTNNYFDTSNNRYLPLISGYYNFTGTVRCNVSSNMTAGMAILYKNGSSYKLNRLVGIISSSSIHVLVTSTIYMNGTTDYVELYGSIAGTSPFFQAVPAPSTIGCSLEGFLVRPD